MSQNECGPSPDKGSVARGNQDRWRKISVQKNKGFLAQPPNKLGFEIAWINRLLAPGEDIPEVEKSLFPRSVIYEIAYKKKQTEIKIREALQREREALAERVKMKLSGDQEESSKQSRQLVHHSADEGEEEERAVDETAQTTPHPPLLNVECPHPSWDEYGQEDVDTSPFQPECHPDPDESREKKIDVFPIDHMRKGRDRGKDRRQLSDVRRAYHKGKTCGDFPGNKMRLTEPWGHLRNEEFLKVGRPFKTEAVKWLECTRPRFDREEEILAIRQRLASKYQQTNY